MRVILSAVTVFIALMVCAANVPQAPFVIYGQILDNGTDAVKDTELKFSITDDKVYTVKVSVSDTGLTYYKLSIPNKDISEVAGKDGFTLRLDKYGSKDLSLKKTGLEYASLYLNWNINIDSSVSAAFTASLIKSKSYAAADGIHTFNLSFNKMTDSDDHIKSYLLSFYGRSGDKIEPAGSETLEADDDKDLYSITHTYTPETGSRFDPDGVFFVVTPLDSSGKKLFSAQVFTPAVKADGGSSDSAKSY